MARIKIWVIRCDNCQAIILADVYYKLGSQDLCRECWERERYGIAPAPATEITEEKTNT